MHYYLFNIGDYRKDTVHLSRLEHGIYRDLIDWYYLEEQPIPKETHSVMRRLRLATDDEAKALQNVLADFFSLTDDGFRQSRIDAEIAQYHANCEKNQMNGKKGGRPKREKTQSVTSGLPTETQVEAKETLTNNHKPITNNQEPSIKEANASLSEPSFPTCPYKKLIQLWAKHLPHLTQPRTWEGSRQTNMRNRWIQAGKPSDYSPEGYATTEDGLKWWDSFFGYIASDTKLAAGFENNGRTWQPDLEWVVNASNFQKIIDGKYNK